MIAGSPVAGAPIAGTLSLATQGVPGAPTGLPGIVTTATPIIS